MDKVQHFEIPVDKVDRAKKFYQKAFGWNMMDYPEMKYTMVHTGKTDSKGMINEMGVINGGMMKRSKKIKSPVVTISVDNIDRSIDNVRMNGGKLVSKKMKVGDMGYAAYVKDTEKNTIGLWQSAKMNM